MSLCMVLGLYFLYSIIIYREMRYCAWLTAFCRQVIISICTLHMEPSLLDINIMEPTWDYVRGTVIAMWFFLSTGYHPPMNFIIEFYSGQLSGADTEIEPVGCVAI